MARTYTPEEIAAVARQTAREVGCEAVCWWQDGGDPRRVYLIAHHRLLSGRTIPVRLMAFIPEALPSPPAQPASGRGA
jgi:hypothetical protein